MKSQYCGTRTRCTLCLIVFCSLVAGCRRSTPGPADSVSQVPEPITPPAPAEESPETIFDLHPRERLLYEKMSELAPIDSLVASLELPVTQCGLGDKIEIMLALRNASDKVVEIPTSSDPGDRCFLTAIALESGQKRVFQYFAAGSKITSLSTILPGENLTQAISLPATVVAGNPLRRQTLPGRYLLIVEYVVHIPEEIDVEVFGGAKEDSQSSIDDQRADRPTGLVRAPAIELEIRQ